MESVRVHDKFPQVLEVRHVGGSLIHYMYQDGNLYPGRVWYGTSPDKHRVTFFLPFPDGTPQVLAVEAPSVI
jgi:hypothetical protein